MKKNKPSWDDIPSLDEVGVDWEFKPTTLLGKRAFIRVKIEDLAKLFSTSKILVKVATVKQTYNGHLFDISPGGLSLILPVSLKENQLLKVGFYLGSIKILSKAIVRYSRKIEDQYATGIQFVDLNSESAEYINGLYASKILRHAT